MLLQRIFKCMNNPLS